MDIKNDIATMREGNTIAQRLLKSHTEPDDNEVAAIARALHATDRVSAHLKDREEDKAIRKSLAEALREGPATGSTGRWSAKAAAPALAAQMGAPGNTDHGVRRKALAPSGVELAPAGLSELVPVSLSKPATSLLQVVPAQVVESPPTYAYLRQTTRTNNAAAVASGGTKPTSIYGLTRVEDRLRVIAHLSEPVDKYWLADAPDLQMFVQDEMTYGLDRAVEAQVLNGDGLGENNRGMLQTSGIQTQAWSTDGYETLRKALTKLQQQGAEGAVVALNPADFETMNLVRATTGEFLATEANLSTGNGGGIAPPYGPTVLASWGVPLVLSNAVAVGQGVAFDPAAVTLYVDGQVAVEWNTSVRFSTNEVIARCEGRFGVAVRKPLLVVSVDMSAL
jgi:HK97 family phage major capsid protein